MNNDNKKNVTVENCMSKRQHLLKYIIANLPSRGDASLSPQALGMEYWSAIAPPYCQKANEAWEQSA